jgi:biotin operon repressor
MENSRDDLMAGLLGVAINEADPIDRTALIERLFAALPPESQERVLLELLSQLGPGPKDPRAGRRRPGPPLRGQPTGRLPVRDIGPWQMCCRMMASVDEAPTVDGLDPRLPAEVFSALGDETRIKIIRLLQDDERSLEEIAHTLGVPHSTLSHHLRVLRTAGLVRVERRGRKSFYSLAQPEESS